MAFLKSRFVFCAQPVLITNKNNNNVSGLFFILMFFQNNVIVSRFIVSKVAGNVPQIAVVADLRREKLSAD